MGGSSLVCVDLSTNINRRDAEFTRDVEFALSPALEIIAYFLLRNSRLRSFVLRALCDSAVLRSLATGLLPNGY